MDSGKWTVDIRTSRNVGGMPAALGRHASGAAAAATGNGELIMGVCGSFLAVELMRQGRTPGESIAEVLLRITKKYKLSEDHQVAMIAMNSAGEWASAAYYESKTPGPLPLDLEHLPWRP